MTDHINDTAAPQSPDLPPPSQNQPPAPAFQAPQVPQMAPQPSQAPQPTSGFRNPADFRPPANPPSPFPAAQGTQNPTQQPAQQNPQQNPQQPDAQKPAKPPLYVFSQACDYIAQGDFVSDIMKFKACANLTTGFPTLDSIQPLYPGLYCLGAISSLGKTTLALQMADQIAMSGRWVIYISLEQTRFELVSKSIARGFFQKERFTTFMNNKPSNLPIPSSIDIRRGHAMSAWPHEFKDQLDRYMTLIQQRMCIVHGAFSMTVDDIVKVIESTIGQIRRIDPGNDKPFIIIDYLQIVAPIPVNGRIPDAKTTIDNAVHVLKALQQQYGLTILAISSLNRQNYLTPIDFESFKESGGIEYTADVIWGLQLSLMNDDTFYHRYDKSGKRVGETSLKEKRAMVNAAKTAIPRKVDLVCLKNRYGRATFAVPLEYYPANDHIWSAYNPGDPDTMPPRYYKEIPPASGTGPSPAGAVNQNGNGGAAKQDRSGSTATQDGSDGTTK